MSLKATNTNSYNSRKTSVHQLYHPCIEIKNTKIGKYKKIISITCKLQKIYTNLSRLKDLLSLLRKNFVGILLNEYTY